MTKLMVGAHLDRPPGPKYTSDLGFAELAFPTSLPRAATLRKWRESLPQGFQVALVAPYAARISKHGAMRFDEDTEAAMSWLHDALDATQANIVVVPTGKELSTSKRHQDHLGEWLQRLDAKDRKVVWAPGGIWTTDLSGPAAKRLGVINAYDPLEDDPPGGDVVYCRMQAVGARQRFTEGVLFDLLDAIIAAEADEAFVAIESPRSFQEARMLRQIALGG